MRAGAPHVPLVPQIGSTLVTEIVKVPFKGQEVLTVEIGGRPHIILRPALEAIGLDYSGQLQRLRRRSWATVGISPTQDQFRDMVTVDVRTFLMLLATIDEKRVAEATRPMLIAYQQEVADAIDRYWTEGGAINPRATEDQLAGIISRAEGQARVLRILEGIVSKDWLEAKARHVAARALGEEPELDPATRPLTVGEYLADQGMTGAMLRSVSTTFGKRLKSAYRSAHLEDPPKVPRFIDGAERYVAGYTEAHRQLFDQVWTDFYSPVGARS